MKQRQFVLAYLAGGFNATAAAIEAGYSPASARQIAAENLAKPAIVAAIEACLAEVGIGRQWVLSEIAALAHGVATDVLEWSKSGVKVRPSVALSREQAALVESVEQEATEFGPRVKVKLRDKLAALNALARALGLPPRRCEVGDQLRRRAGPGSISAPTDSVVL